jgi:hypothetical protein
MLLSIPGPTSARSDLLEVLCTGHAGSMPFMAAVLGREPLVDAVIIPTRVTGSASVTSAIIRRYMRLYFPRTYEDLVEKYEFLILRGLDAYYFTTEQSEWMRRAIEEGGLGGLADRSVMSSLGSYATPYALSPMSEAFPNDADAVVSVDYSRTGVIEVALNDDPRIPQVLAPYKDLLDYNVGLSGNTLMIPMEGSTTYTWIKSGDYSEFAFPDPGWFPHTLGWQYGEGYTWNLMDYSLSGFWGEGMNPYGPDAYWGMLMYSTGRDLPVDVVMVHSLRVRFHHYAEQKGFIIAMIDFVDRFGANTGPLEVALGEMDGQWRESRELYLGQSYQSAWATIEEVLTEMSLLRGDALKIKDRALLWIYVIEWLTVSGTFLATGFAIWTLMVRRRLYKQVATTRLVLK